MSEAAAPAVDWQPIETAPKGGVMILVTNGSYIWIASHNVFERFVNGVRQSRTEFWTRATDWPGDTEDPTHWVEAPLLPDGSSLNDRKCEP